MSRSRPAGPNRTPAVMQSRREPHDSLDDFPTPPWGTRALLERLDGDLRSMTSREPCANRGFMVRPLDEAFGAVDALDIFDYGAGFRVEDYLFGPLPEAVDWTIANPPYRLAEKFIDRMLATSRRGCAVLVRSAWTEGIVRHRDLFSTRPPSRVLQFVERLPMVKGRVDGKARSATAYVWVVWEMPAIGNATRLEWIAPCRRRLERPGDYDTPE